MAKKCAPCLSDEVKDLLVRSFPVLAEQLSLVGACDSGVMIDLCVKKKSAYQEFTASCMKEKSGGGFNPSAMRECAADWRRMKERA